MLKKMNYDYFLVLFEQYVTFFLKICVIWKKNFFSDNSLGKNCGKYREKGQSLGDFPEKN